MSDKVVLVSGGFDPIHIGHIQLFKGASGYGRVIVAVNSDDWLTRKKGYVFMPQHERCEIIAAMECVDKVYPIKRDIRNYHGRGGHSFYLQSSKVITNDRLWIQDDDNTCIDAIRLLVPDIFANGGDRTQQNVPEQAICEALGVDMIWGIGGQDKPQSSSWLVNNAMRQLGENNGRVE